MADTLATTADLAAALQVDVGDLDATAATLALELSTAVVQAAVGQRIVEVVDDEVTIDLDDTDGGLYLDLPEGPVTAVSSVSVGDSLVTDYSLQASRGRLWRSMGWRSATLPVWNEPSFVTVIYTHGRPPGHQDLQLARAITTHLAAGAYGSPAGGVVMETIDDYSVRYAEASGALSVSPFADALRRKYGRPAGSVRLTAR